MARRGGSVMRSGRPTIRDLDQVSVGVPKVDRSNRAGGPGSVHGTLHDLDTVAFQVDEPRLDRRS